MSGLATGVTGRERENLPLLRVNFGLGERVESLPVLREMDAVVFDFDHSLVEECSDLWVLEHLGQPGLRALEHLRDYIKVHPLRWNEGMQEAAGLLFRAGVPRAALEQAAAQIPVFPQMLATVNLAHQLGIACHIVSDANECWIGEFLKGSCFTCTGCSGNRVDYYRPASHTAHHIRERFASINTNPASFDESGQLRIGPHHPESATPHGCNLAPVNMDKCGVLRELGLTRDRDAEREATDSAQNQHKKGRVFYVGDGSGDLCAALALGS